MKNLSQIINRWSIVLFLTFSSFVLLSITGFGLNNLLFVIFLIILFVSAAFLVEYLYKKFLFGKKVSSVKIIVAIIAFFIFVVLITKLIVFLLNRF